MKIPTNRSIWLALGLLSLVLVLAACVRPVPVDDLTPTPEGVVAPTLPAVQPTAVPEVLPSPTPGAEAEPTAVPEQPTTEPTAVPPTDGGSGGQGGETIHVVAPGDTLYSISQRYGVPMADIMAANNLVNPNYLVVGQQLVIPAPGSGSTPPPDGGTGGVVAVHTVRPGENLFRIGLQYNCTVDQVAQFNGIPYPYTIYPGQQINIPAC